MKIDLSTILEMVEEEDKKIKENKAPVQLKQEKATLDLQGLFSLFEELEPTLKEDVPSLSGREIERAKRAAKEIVVTPEKVLQFIVPQVVYRERNIAANKQMVDNLVNQYLTGDTVVGRLQQLVKLADSATEEKTGSGDIKHLVNRIAVIDGIVSVFQSFEATTAGSVSEQVIASLFGKEAKRLGTKETTDAGYMTDVTIGEKPYGIKTVSPKSNRRMSAFNFAKTLSENLSIGITLLDCEKIIENGEVTGFNVVEEVARRDTDNVRLVPLGGQNNFMYRIDTGKSLETIDDLYLAYKYPKNIMVVENGEETNLEDHLKNQKGDEKQARVKGFSFYAVEHVPQQQPQEIKLKYTSEILKKQLTEMTSSVMKQIVRLKNSLEDIAKGMSEFFVAENKEQVRNEILAAADEVVPSAEQATKEE